MSDLELDMSRLIRLNLEEERKSKLYAIKGNSDPMDRMVSVQEERNSKLYGIKRNSDLMDRKVSVEKERNSKLYPNKRNSDLMDRKVSVQEERNSKMYPNQRSSDLMDRMGDLEQTLTEEFDELINEPRKTIARQSSISSMPTPSNLEEAQEIERRETMNLRNSGHSNGRIERFESRLNQLMERNESIHQQRSTGGNISGARLKKSNARFDPYYRTEMVDEDVYDWISDWMVNVVKLPQYLDVFIENGYEEASVIQTLTPCDLHEMGIDKKGHQIKILQTIENLNDPTEPSKRISNRISRLNDPTERMSKRESQRIRRLPKMSSDAFRLSQIPFE